MSDTTNVAYVLDRPAEPGAKKSIFVIANRDIYVDGLLRLIDELPGLEILTCASPGENC